MRISRLVRIAVIAVSAIVSTSLFGVPASAQPPHIGDSPGSRLLLDVAGLPPIQALAQITRQLFGPNGEYLPWTYRLPPLPVPHTPQVVECPSGAAACVQEAVTEMDDRAKVMMAHCDDNAPMMLTYLHTTKAEHALVEREGGFRDPAWLNNWDVHYARVYFAAIDNYYHGHRDRVPESWQQSFRASDTHALTVLGSTALAYNAHITHDLPYVITDMGVTAPDGASHKPDSERVDAMLDATEPEVITQLTALYGRSDPTLTAGSNLEPMVHMAFGQTIQIWREYAWRAAEQLLLAHTPQQKSLISAQIESLSKLLGNLILTLFARDDPGPHLTHCPSGVE